VGGSMKKLVTLLIVSFLLPAYAQNIGLKHPFLTPDISPPHNSQTQSYKRPYDLKQLHSFNSMVYLPQQVVIDDTTRYTYTYDISGKLLAELHEWLSNNVWVNTWKTSYTYDDNGDMLIKLSAYWENNAWVNYSRYTYTNDNKGNALVELGENWMNNDWVNSDRYTFTYDNNNYWVTELYESWTNNAWINSFRITLTLDNIGNRLAELDEIWINNAWMNSNRYTNTYDNNGNQITKLTEKWINNAWAISFRSTYTYDNNGNKLTYLGENWTNNVWVNSGRSTYTYDNAGNQITYISEQYTNNTWVNSAKATYTYDANGNALYGEYFIWGNSWIAGNGLFFFYYNFKKNVQSYYGHIVNISYISITEVIENNIPINGFGLAQNYPNPFNPSTKIQYSIAKSNEVTLKVFDILGREMAVLVNELKEAGIHEVLFDASKFVSGIYVYTLISGNFLESKKMLLMK
jgi:hypothetical protein